jgi:inhibitor of KinA sporulation pathway (predicted exonuclease)
MAIRLDQVIVIDIEATCWEKDPPPNQEREIIEIGICPLDIASGELLEKKSLLVKPKQSQVSDFCTQLTTLTPEQVNQGMSLGKACSILRNKYIAHQRIWASYGEFDKRQFQIQCEKQGVRYPFSNRHLNVKTLFSVMYALEREVGMAEALNRLNLPLEGTHHRGHDDAWNIARILSKLMTYQR